jgi:hypothetical protein
VTAAIAHGLNAVRRAKAAVRARPRGRIAVSLIVAGFGAGKRTVSGAYWRDANKTFKKDVQIRHDGFMLMRMSGV